MQPIRRKQQYEVTDDPFTGQERPLEAAGETDVLSDEGSVDSLVKRKRYFRDCGCDGPPGGRCAECGAISCVRCHGHCQRCGKPICREHSVVLELPDRGPVRLCQRCRGGLVRHRRLVNIARTLLSPFIRFEP